MSYTVTDHQLYCAKPRIMSAEDLKVWMSWHGLGQTDVALAAKVNRRTVYNWLNEVHHIPRTVWPSLAQHFGNPLPRFIEPVTAPDMQVHAGYTDQHGNIVYEPATNWPYDAKDQITK